MKRKNFINKKLSKQSGIALVALVVSIIVLLILATVSVQILTGDNGLLTKAEQAKNTTVEAEGLERIQLAVMASHDNRGINTTSLAKNLSEINGLTDTNNQAITEITLPKSIMLNNIKYKIKIDGTVIINNSILPDEYEQVEYIESSGTQWIDTGTEIDNGYTINTDILFTDFQNNYLITGTYGMESIVSINDNARYFIRIDKNTGNLHYQYGSSTKYGQTILQLNTKYNIECKLINNMQYLKLDNYFLFSTSINKYQPKTSLIFLGNIDNNNDGISIRNICHAKAYNCKYYDSNDKLIRDFIPCYSTTTVTDVNGKQCSAGTSGMYDTVEGKFYTNQGTGTFGYETEDGTYVAPSPTNN